MESTQNFLGGLNLDRSQLQTIKNSYIDGLNLDVIIDEINGSFVLTNAKGNKLQSSIPASYKIHNWSVTNTAGQANISINGVLTEWGTSATSTNFDLYNFIISYYSSLINSDSIRVFYSQERVVIVEQIALGYTDVNGTVTRNLNLEVPAINTHYPIGYGVIDRDIYILTTPCNDIDPITTGNGWGFIWKFTYDYENFDPLLSNFELIYGANLNFSTYWNIPSTGIVTRYETDAIKKIWITDNYNPLRSFNVSDPNIMTEDPKIFSVNPNITIYKPIFVSLLEGGSANLHGGVYQSYYKLTKNLSKDSINSEFSNLVSVGATAVTSSYEGYVGGTGSTPKIITWQVNNIDTNFDNIEFYVIVRETDDYGLTRTIYKVDTRSINNQTSINFSVDWTAISTGTVITDSQATVQQYNGFTHCKTIAEKDNLLIAANLRSETINNIGDFDTRAFRASSSTGNIEVITNGSRRSYGTLQAAINTPETDDNINDYFGTYPCYVKPGTNVLGGAGKNISYTFVTELSIVDSETGNASAFAPFFRTAKYNSIQNLGEKAPTNFQLYPNGNGSTFYQGFKNPQTSGLLKGYMRGEVYRFAIQFYTKSMEPLFAKWIGDIKFPDAFDSNPTSPTGDFRTLYVSSDGTAYSQSLGIQFSITGLDAISSDIGGYSIVRVDRKYGDRTIINQGFINSAVDGLADSVSCLYAKIDAALGVDTDGNLKRFFLHLPRVGSSGKTINTGSIIKPIYQSTDTVRIEYANPSNVNDIQRTVKNYSLIKPPNYNSEFTINQATLLSGIEDPTNAPVESISSKRLLNRVGSGVISNFGQTAYFINLNSTVSSVGNGGLLIINNTSSNPNQYGGSTYSDRSNSTYISCGHFRPIPLGIIADPIEQPEVFGGDTFIGLYDSLTYRKNWAYPSNTTMSRLGYANIVPLETDINIDLMNADRANVQYTKAFNDSHADQIETGGYFTAYSASNDARIFAPQPNVFFTVNKWINRFAASNVKINGELVDSWSTFPINDVWDAEGQYGPINAILSHNSKLFFWQDRSFGILQVNPRVAFSDTTNPSIDSQIQLGFGNKIQRHDYISNVSGTNHQNSVLNTKGSLYWLDTNLRKIYRFIENKDGSSLQPLSDMKGLYAYISKNFNNILQDKPCYNGSNGISGVSCIYNTQKDRLHYTIHNGLKNGTQNSFTLTYNELTDTFITFNSFKPKLYLTDNKNVFSFNDTNTIYVHNKGNFSNYYGTTYKSYVKYIINDGPERTKVFDNQVINTQSIDLVNNIDNNRDTWNRLRITNDYQNTGFQDLIYNSNIKRIERKWQLSIPRNRVLYTTSDSPNIYTDLSPTDKLYGERIRDKYIQVELEYDNTDNFLLKTNSISTIFRESIR